MALSCSDKNRSVTIFITGVNRGTSFEQDSNGVIVSSPSYCDYEWSLVSITVPLNVSALLDHRQHKLFTVTVSGFANIIEWSNLETIFCLMPHQGLIYIITTFLSKHQRQFSKIEQTTTT